MSKFFFEPVPHEEAVKFIAGKPLVTQQVFKNLLPELKARAFTVAGIECFDTLANVRQAISELPAGGDWEDIKGRVLDEISPFLVTSDDPEERAKQEHGAERRAELLLRTHGFQAYNAAAYREMDAQRDLFPYWQYQSLGDGRVRATHAALDGVVLPAGSSFWQSHYPPWEWGCRCQVIPLSPEDMAEIKAADAALPPEKQRVLEGPMLKKLEDERILIRPADVVNGKGMATPINVSSAAEKGVPGAFQWHPGDLQLTTAQLEQRYAHDPQTWQAFQTWAKQTKIPQTKKTVWQWLEGPKPKAPKAPKAEPEPQPPAPTAPVEAALLDRVQVVRSLGGSTGAELVEDPQTGARYVRKRGANADHLRSEVQADQVYRALGVPVPEPMLFETDKGPVKLAPFIEGQTLGEYLKGATKAQRAALTAQVQSHFVADALLANWDVAGLSLDNLLVDARGVIWRIGNGGSLRFRAQGGAKAFGPNVEELTTLRDPKKNPQTAKLFATLTEEDIHAQIRTVLGQRDALLSAAPPDLRDALAARMDDLESRLPRPPAAAGHEALASEVRAARIVGKATRRDRGDIEDAQALLWEEQNAAGEKTLRAKLKLTEGGSAKLIERLRASLPAPSPAQAAAAPPDEYWPKILAAAKTVSTHAGDKKYNQATLDTMTALKPKLAALLDREQAAHYSAIIAQIEEAKAQGKATPATFSPYVPPKKNEPQAPQPKPEFDVRRTQVAYIAKETDRGRATATSQEIYSHESLLVQVGDAKIKFVPFRDVNNAEFSAPYALRGYIEVEQPGGAEPAALAALEEKLTQLGLDFSPAEPAYLEAMYLRKGMQIRSDVFSEAQRTEVDAMLADTTMPTAEKVAKLKASIKDRMGLDLPAEPTATYQPTGRGNAFGQGWERTERWDLPRAQVEKEMKKYLLHHGTSTPLPELLDSLLNGGGDFTCTTERLRKGVPINKGMSPQADLSTGGANYLFTRIQSRSKAEVNAGLNFKIGNLARQDAFTFDHDRYGNVKDASCYAERKKTVEEMKAASKRGGNETIFKWGIPLLDEVESIVVGSEAEKKRVLEVFRKHKIDKLPDGRSVESIITVK